MAETSDLEMEVDIGTLERKRGEILEIIRDNCGLDGNQAQNYVTDLEERVVAYQPGSPTMNGMGTNSIVIQKKLFCIGLKEMLSGANGGETLKELMNLYKEGFVGYIKKRHPEELFDFESPYSERQHLDKGLFTLIRGALFCINMGHLIKLGEDTSYLQGLIGDIEALKDFEYNLHVKEGEKSRLRAHGSSSPEYASEMVRLIKEYTDIADQVLGMGCFYAIGQILVNEKPNDIRIEELWVDKIKERVTFAYKQCLDLYYELAEPPDSQVSKMTDLMSFIPRSYWIYTGLTFGINVGQQLLLGEDKARFYGDMTSPTK